MKLFRRWKQRRARSGSRSTRTGPTIPLDVIVKGDPVEIRRWAGER